MEEPREEFVEIDLREYINVLFRKWKITAAIFLVAVFFSGVYSFFILEPTYEVEADLMISQPAYTTDFNSSIFNKREYKQLFTTPGLAEEVISELDLDSERYTSERLLQKVTVDIDAQEENGSQIINIIYKTSRPETGYKIVNKWIELFEQHSLRLLKDRVRSAEESINNQYSNYKSQLKELEAEFDQFQTEERIDLLEDKIEDRQDKVVDYEARLMEIKTNISKKKAVVEELKKALKGEKEIYQLKRALLDDEMLDKLGIGEITTEELNPLYIEFKKELKNNQAELEELKAEEAVVKVNLEETNQEISKLKKELTAQKRRRENLTDEMKVVRNRYEELKSKVSIANTALDVQTSGLEIAGEPVVPKRPTGPNKKLNLAIAGVLGLMLGVFAAFISEFLAVEEEPIKG